MVVVLWCAAVSGAVVVVWCWWCVAGRGEGSVTESCGSDFIEVQPPHQDITQGHQSLWTWLSNQRTPRQQQSRGECLLCSYWL